jgi:hypothetical protein
MNSTLKNENCSDSNQLKEPEIIRIYSAEISCFPVPGKDIDKFKMVQDKENLGPESLPV